MSGSRVWVVAIAAVAWTSTGFAQWRNAVSENEMTKQVEAYALSQAVESTRPMQPPYQGTTAWLGVGCSGAREWAFIGFSEAPNIVDDLTQDGYNVIAARIRWDETTRRALLSQEWGSPFLMFDADENAIPRVEQSGTALLELNWYGQGQTYFEFSLIGATAAIGEIRGSCEPQRREDEDREAQARLLKQYQDEARAEILEDEIAVCLEDGAIGRGYCEAILGNKLLVGRDGYIRSAEYRSRHVERVQELISE
jgi:hypothetical protein